MGNCRPQAVSGIRLSGGGTPPLHAVPAVPCTTYRSIISTRTATYFRYLQRRLDCRVQYFCKRAVVRTKLVLALIGVMSVLAGIGYRKSAPRERPQHHVGLAEAPPPASELNPAQPLLPLRSHLVATFVLGTRFGFGHKNPCPLNMLVRQRTEPPRGER